MSDDFVRAELKIYGKVQGVFFRANTQKEARRRGLTGWVKNMADGTVEATIEGPNEPVKELVEWAHEGSPAARVDNVEASWEEATGDFDSFEIRY